MVPLKILACIEGQIGTGVCLYALGPGHSDRKGSETSDG
jgi:hypothetical protein